MQIFQNNKNKYATLSLNNLTIMSKYKQILLN
jgi:hypothetical protein